MTVVVLLLSLFVAAMGAGPLDASFGERSRGDVPRWFRTLRGNGGQALPHERLWLVVQGYAVSQAEEKAARQTAARTGVGAVIVARARIDQSFEPRIAPVKK